MEEPEEDSRAKKISKIIIALLLMSMLAYLVVPYDVLFSLLGSNKIKGSELILTNKTIMFKPDVLGGLREFYLENQMTEISICLTGYVKENEYRITGFYPPKAFFKTPISIMSEHCSNETIITLHTHPFRSCLFSYQDIVSHNSYKRTNQKAIAAVMCDVDRFAFSGD